MQRKMQEEEQIPKPKKKKVKPYMPPDAPKTYIIREEIEEEK